MSCRSIQSGGGENGPWRDDRASRSCADSHQRGRRRWELKPVICGFTKAFDWVSEVRERRMIWDLSVAKNANSLSVQVPLRRWGSARRASARTRRAEPSDLEKLSATYVTPWTVGRSHDIAGGQGDACNLASGRKCLNSVLKLGET